MTRNTARISLVSLRTTRKPNTTTFRERKVCLLGRSNCIAPNGVPMIGGNKNVDRTDGNRDYVSVRKSNDTGTLVYFRKVPHLDQKELPTDLDRSAEQKELPTD